MKNIGSFIFLIILLTGCTSLSVQVEKLVSKGSYVEARKLLEEENVGESISHEMANDEEALLARERFRVLLEQDAINLKNDLNRQGKPREASNKLTEFVRLCPWSKKIKLIKEEQDQLISNLNKLNTFLVKASNRRWSVSGNLDLQREVLNLAKEYETLLNDSPDIRRHITDVEDVVLEDWTVKIVNKTELEKEELKRFLDDLNLIRVPDHYQRQISQTHTFISRFNKDQNSDFEPPHFRNESLNVFVSSSQPGPPALSALRDALHNNLKKVYIPFLKKVLNDPQIKYEMVQFGEQVRDRINTQVTGIDSWVSLAHLNRARQLAPTGRASMLALLHLKRAGALGLPLDDPRLVKIEKTAITTFSSAGQYQLPVQIITNPRDPPFLQEMVGIQIYKHLQRHVTPHIRLKLLSPYAAGSAITLTINSINMMIPDQSDLQNVTSSYLSHFEDVPNPTKDYYESQLSSQKISVSFAESSLDSAISSHNIYPTRYSLMNVNNARNNYVSAVDRYNSLVRIYNMTPSTISRPVFMPYIFQEGKVFHGWRITGDIHVSNSNKERFSVSRVDDDFVRIGSRLDDREEKYRRQDFLDIPVGFDRLFEQLNSSIDSIIQKLSAMLTEINFEDRLDLNREEERVLSTILHPFGDLTIVSSSNLPKWSRNLISKIQIPHIQELQPPNVKIVGSQKQYSLDSAETAFDRFSKAVVLIFSEGESASIGSGAVIRKDGLILTCAHVLLGKKIEVALPAVGTKKYQTEIVFINELHDVALLKIKNFETKKWIPVALEDETISGEAVIALGNPSLGEGNIAINSLAQGIIAKPFLSDDQSSLDRIVANITISSGSSGGPLISMKTGKIVGVITAVMAPTVSKDFASSGYRALAAPSNMMKKWLGLVYQ